MTSKGKRKEIYRNAVRVIIPKIDDYPPSCAKESITLLTARNTENRSCMSWRWVHLIYPQDYALPLRGWVQATRLGLSAPSPNNNVKGEKQ